MAAPAVVAVLAAATALARPMVAPLVLSQLTATAVSLQTHDSHAFLLRSRSAGDSEAIVRRWSRRTDNQVQYLRTAKTQVQNQRQTQMQTHIQTQMQTQIDSQIVQEERKSHIVIAETVESHSHRRDAIGTEEDSGNSAETVGKIVEYLHKTKPAMDNSLSEAYLRENAEYALNARNRNSWAKAVPWVRD
jgi:hypothetical protein